MKRRFLHFIAMHPPGLALPERFFSLVREHPELCIPETETHYFSSDKITKGSDWYEGHFSACEDGTHRGEISTSYLNTTGVAARAARDYPDARLVVVICDPIEAVVSAYRAAVSDGAKAPSLEEWLERQPQLLETYKFGRQLMPFFTYYSPVDLLVLTFGDIRTAPAKVTTAVYEHLEVAKTFLPKVLQVLAEEEELRPGFWARKLRLDRLRKRRRTARLVVANSTFPPLKIEITPRERVLLTRYFEHDVDQLSELLHRDLRAEWGYVKEGSEHGKH